MREAPSRVLIDALIEQGATVRAYDSEALHEAKKLYPSTAGLIFCETQEDTLTGGCTLCGDRMEKFLESRF